MASAPNSDFSLARKVRVLIPTTSGVVEVLRIADERAQYPRSTVRINLDISKAAGIDAAYNEFVNSPSGLIERHYGHNRFRVDVSGAIDVGNSWQAGLMVAHALHATGRLAMRNEKGEGDAADAIIWITGELRIDHRVVRVGDVVRKLQLSSDLFAGLAAEGLPVRLCVPHDNAVEVEVHGALSALGETDMRRFIAARDINDALSALGLPAVKPDSARLSQWSGNPYRGLAVFDIEHSPIFFGRKDARERACATLLANADNDGLSFLLVTGQSGSGKSSLARAGLVGDLAKVRAGHWLAAVTTPLPSTDASLDALALAVVGAMGKAGSVLDELFREQARKDPEAATRTLVAELDVLSGRLGATAHLVLVVDQLEHALLSARVDDDEPDVRDAERYGRLLRCLAASRRIWVIATLRSDLFHLIDLSRSLASMVRETSTFLLPRPLQHEIREIIRRPAMLAGAVFEVENPQNPADAYSLADQIEHDAAAFGDHPSLPLLEFALSLLFERRSPHDVIEHKTYNEMGRLSGAIARYADQTLEQAFEGAIDRFELEEALKWTLLNLSHVERLESANQIDPPKARAVGNRMRLSEHIQGAPRKVIDILVTSRLVELDTANGQTTARLAHDALFECWPRLSSLVSNYRDDLLLRDELLAQYRHWQTSDRTAWFLQSDALDEARALKARWANNLDGRLVEFIDLSETRARKQARNWNRLRNAVAVAIGAAGLIAAVGWWQATRAYQSARVNMLAAVDANREVSEQVLAIYYKSGLRTGVAQQLIGDAAERLDALSAAELETANSRLIGGAPKADLLLALSTTLLNFSEIELEQRGADAMRGTRLSRVQSALDAAERAQAPKQEVARLRARLHFIQGNAAAQAGTPDEAIRHYNNAMTALGDDPKHDQFLKGRILQGLGNAAYGPAAGLRAQYLQAALDELQRLPAERSREPSVLREILALQLSLAYVEIDGGNFAAAAKRLSEALRLQDSVPPETRDAPAIKYERTRLDLALALAYRCRGGLDEAREAIDRNLVALKELLVFDSENPQYRQDQALAGIENAEIFRTVGRLGDAQTVRAQAEGEWAMLRKQHPDLFVDGEEQLSPSDCQVHTVQ